MMPKNVAERMTDGVGWIGVFGHGRRCFAGCVSSESDTASAYDNIQSRIESAQAPSSPLNFPHTSIFFRLKSAFLHCFLLVHACVLASAPKFSVM